jgi:hypothetical protein
MVYSKSAPDYHEQSLGKEKKKISAERNHRGHCNPDLELSEITIRGRGRGAQS